MCVIKVGAATEVELKEKKHRLEDAISATRAAVEEGIVSGGGSALVHAVKVLEGNLGKTGDEATGVAVVRRAAVEPLRWIAENAGLEGYVITSKVAELDKGHGFNAATGEYGDLVKAGVIDPVKVTRSALENAASIASLLLTTETLVVEKPGGGAAEAGHGHGHAPLTRTARLEPRRPARPAPGNGGPSGCRRPAAQSRGSDRGPKRRPAVDERPRRAPARAPAWPRPPRPCSAGRARSATRPRARSRRAAATTLSASSHAHAGDAARCPSRPARGTRCGRSPGHSASSRTPVPARSGPPPG